MKIPSLAVYLFLITLSLGCATTKLQRNESESIKKPSPFLIYSGADLDHPYSGTGTQLPNGDVLIAFEKWTNDRKPPFESHIWLVRVNDGKVTDAAIRLEKKNKNFTYHPQFVSDSRDTYLYYNVFNVRSNTASFERLELTNGSFGKKTPLAIHDKLIGQYRPWIYPYISKSGPMILTFEWRDPVLERQRLKFAVGKNGLAFDESVDFGIGVMGRTSQFADGTFIYTYQNGDPERTMDYFKISKNARQWTFDRPISDQKDVHDCIPFQRLDGGIDLYYISSGTGTRNSVFRRTIDQTGALGPEEELTNKVDGSFMAPHPIRLGNGTVFLVLTKEVKEQVNYDLFAIYVSGDAPSGARN